ncbi:MAG: hypothetical protein ACI3VN_03115 [Candidatus Onthomonas sp.]
MKLIRRLSALLLALTLCLSLLTGCASDSTASQKGEENEQQEAELIQEQEPEQDQPAADTDAEASSSEEEEPFTDFDVYTVGDLKLTQVDDTISTMEYLSCNGKTLTVPVFQNANWDNVQIAEDKTFVEVTNTTGEALLNLDGVYYCTYYSEEQAYYDLDDIAQQYSDVFEESQIYPKTASEDGTVHAIAVHGLYQGNEIYQYMITIDHEDEYAVMDLSFYTSDASIAEPLLDYWGVPNPAVD